jgi:hypothetical protein
MRTTKRRMTSKKKMRKRTKNSPNLHTSDQALWSSK